MRNLVSSYKVWIWYCYYSCRPAFLLKLLQKKNIEQEVGEGAANICFKSGVKFEVI